MGGKPPLINSKITRMAEERNLNMYDLSRKFWDFAFDNPEKIKSNHCAVYFFSIEHCNRLGWKDKFGLPSSMVKEATGIKSYNTYKKTLDDLVEFGFITMIEQSKNQYSSNIIALSNFNNTHNKALDKALIKHTSKQSESTIQSTGESNDSIDKQIYNNTNSQDYQFTKDACEVFEILEDEEDLSDLLKTEKEEKEKSSAKKEKENQELRDSEFFSKVCDYFSQTSREQKDRVFGDMIRIRSQGDFETFQKQTEAYMDYKSTADEKHHSWNNYPYQWQTENWIDKLQKLKSKNGKSTHNTSESRVGKSSGRAKVLANGNITEFT